MWRVQDTSCVAAYSHYSSIALFFIMHNFSTKKRARIPLIFSNLQFVLKLWHSSMYQYFQSYTKINFYIYMYVYKNSYSLLHKNFKTANLIKLLGKILLYWDWAAINLAFSQDVQMFAKPAVIMVCLTLHVLPHIWTGWGDGLGTMVWGSAKWSARSCSSVTKALFSAMGWGQSGWKTAQLKRTCGCWLKVAEHESACAQLAKKSNGMWPVSKSVWPARQGQWLCPCTQHC